jgi:hypothetical protein
MVACPAPLCVDIPLYAILGRYRRVLSLLHRAGRKGDPLRRSGGRGSAGLGPASLTLAEWPDWIPTPEIRARLGPYPHAFPGGPANPLGARALYLYEGNKDTLYRIHGTNQPKYIGQAISSGCIRMTDEDVIDLFDRVKQGPIVVVFAPGQSGWIGPFAGPRG